MIDTRKKILGKIVRLNDLVPLILKVKKKHLKIQKKTSIPLNINSFLLDHHKKKRTEQKSVKARSKSSLIFSQTLLFEGCIFVKNQPFLVAKIIAFQVMKISKDKSSHFFHRKKVAKTCLWYKISKWPHS